MRETVAKSLTRDFMHAVYEIRAGELTAADLGAVRNLFFDNIGVTAGGAQTPTARVVRNSLAKQTAEPDILPIIGTPDSTNAVDAAFANAVAAHCLEFDDTHAGASLHPGAVVFPAALAASVMARATAEEFVEGVVTGYEVMCRVGRALDPKSHYERHFHPTATAGSLAAAATAARILGLNAEQASQAVGTACTMAAGSLEFLRDGAWTKRLHPGLAVRNGILAASLVKDGFRAPTDGIGGVHGLLATYSADPHPDLLLDGLGSVQLEIHNTGIKAHGCCRYNQGPIDAVLGFRKERPLAVGEIEEIRVGVVSAALGLIWDPPESKRRPDSVVEAQFSLPYSVAIALKEGRADPAEFDPVRVGDVLLDRLMDSVECIADPNLDRDYPDRWRCWVEIRTQDGKTHRSDLDEAKGEPGNPFTTDELAQKVRRLTPGVYSSSRLDKIAGCIAELPAGTSLNRLIGLLGSDA